MKRHSKLAALGGIAIMAATSLTLGSQEVTAADHADGDQAGMDGPADIADVYAWHTDNDTIVAIVTFAALQAPGAEASYDRDVLYTLHLDNTALTENLSTAAEPASNTNDNESDLQVNIRFGQNGLGDWGVQVEGLPGSTETFQGAVDTDLDNNGAMAHAGTFDDPFSFDLTGFNTTIANTLDDAEAFDLAFGSLADIANDNIVPAPDALVGTNVHAIVLEFPAADALNGNADNLLQVWATSSRITE